MAKEPESTEAAAPATTMRVRATKPVYYDHHLKRIGDVFDIEPSAFSKTAMVKVAADTPIRRRNTATNLMDYLQAVKTGDAAGLGLPESSPPGTEVI